MAYTIARTFSETLAMVDSRDQAGRRKRVYVKLTGAAQTTAAITQATHELSEIESVICTSNTQHLPSAAVSGTTVTITTPSGPTIVWVEIVGKSL